MAIITNFYFFKNDVYQSIRLKSETLENHMTQQIDFFSKLKNISFDIIDTSKLILKKAFLHYPKTMRIAFIINLIVIFIFPSISRFIGLGLEIYIFLKNNNLLSKSIRIYNNENVSEWTSSVAEKQRIIDMIDPLEQLRSFLPRIKNYVGMIFNH